MEIIAAYAGPDAIWDGCNSEFADADNPNGDLYVTKLCTVAETRDGRRFLHFHHFDLEEQERADAFACRVAAAGSINLEHWAETYEIYGSAAWEEADAERQFQWESNPATRGTVRDF